MPSNVQLVLEATFASIGALVLAPFLVELSQRRQTWLVVTTVVGSALALTAAAGPIALLLQSDWAGLFGSVTGFGHVREFGSRSLPTGSQLTAEAAALGLFGLAVTGCLLLGRALLWRTGARWLGLCLVVLAVAVGIHLYVTYQIGLDMRAHGSGPYPTFTQDALAGQTGSDLRLIKRSLVVLRDTVKNHFFPLLVPLALSGLVLLRWNKAQSVPARNLALLMLGLCIACRSRRVFSQTDWFHFLMEIPVYLLVARALWDWPTVRRGLTFALVALTGFGGYFYVKAATLRQYSITVPVETPRGTVRLYPEERDVYQQLRRMLEQIDPSGQRPLFAIGSSGGYNYFLNRPNPTPLSQGFTFTRFSPEQLVARMLVAERPILIYHESFLAMKTPLPSLTRYGWEPEMGPIHFARVDAAHFAHLRAACRKVGETAGLDLIFYVHDCAQGSEPARAASRPPSR